MIPEAILSIAFLGTLVLFGLLGCVETGFSGGDDGGDSGGDGGGGD